MLIKGNNLSEMPLPLMGGRRLNPSSLIVQYRSYGFALHDLEGSENLIRIQIR
jgi:hypothetical protein